MKTILVQQQMLWRTLRLEINSAWRTWLQLSNISFWLIPIVNMTCPLKTTLDNTCPATKNGDNILTLPEAYLVKKSPWVVCPPANVGDFCADMGLMWKLQLRSPQSRNLAAKHWFILEEPADRQLFGQNLWHTDRKPEFKPAKGHLGSGRCGGGGGGGWGSRTLLWNNRALISGCGGYR